MRPGKGRAPEPAAPPVLSREAREMIYFAAEAETVREFYARAFRAGGTPMHAVTAALGPEIDPSAFAAALEQMPAELRDPALREARERVASDLITKLHRAGVPADRVRRITQPPL